MDKRNLIAVLRNIKTFNGRAAISGDCIAADNGSLRAEYHVDGMSIEPCTIDVSRLLRVLNAMPNRDINIATEGGKLIAFGSITVSVPASEFDPFLFGKPHKFSTYYEFPASISKAVFGTRGIDTVIEALEDIHIEPRNGVIVSSDGFRMTVVTTDHTADIDDFDLCGITLGMAIKLSPTRLAVSSNENSTAV